MAVSKFFFAYGSELNWSVFSSVPVSRGTNEGYGVAGLLAYLPDYEGFFRAQPQKRGGILDLEARGGQVVSGMLYELSESHWEQLEKGVRGLDNYGMSACMVLTPEGRQIGAQTLRLNHGGPSAYEAPDQAYLDLLGKGRSALGLDISWLDRAALGQGSTFSMDRLFVYGTLMRGECRFRILDEDCGIRGVEPASVSGLLVDLGSYPGLLEPERSGQRVWGELITLSNPERAFQILDPIEDFLGWQEPGSMYHRILMPVTRQDGQKDISWVYRLAEPPSQKVLISHGDWRVRGAP